MPDDGLAEEGLHFDIECSACRFDMQKVGMEWDGPGRWKQTYRCPCCGAEKHLTSKRGHPLPYTQDRAIEEIEAEYMKGTITEGELERSLDKALGLEDDGGR